MRKFIYLFIILAFVSCSSNQDGSNNSGNTITDNGQEITTGYLMDDNTSTVIALVGDNKVRYQPFRSYLRYMLGIDPDTIPAEITKSILDTWISREAVYFIAVEEGLDRDSTFIFMTFDASRQILSEMVLERISLSIPGVTEAEIREAYDKWKEEVKYEKDVILYQFLTEDAAQNAIEQIKEDQADSLISGLIVLDTIKGVRRLYSNMELLEEAVASMKLGEVSESFRIGEGFYVAKIINEKYIESPIAPFDQLRPYIMLYLTEINKFKFINNFVDTLISQNVTIFEDSLQQRVIQ